MPTTQSLVVALAPLVIYFVTSIVFPTVEVLGLLRSPINLNNADCQTIPGLEACEDAWISQASGLAYLPCSSMAARQTWAPAVDHLNATGRSSFPSDQLVLLDLNTHKHNPLQLTNLPSDFPGLFLHAIDVFEHPASDKLTIIVNSHRPQEGAAEGLGARSVIEVFETTSGSKEARWVKTVEDELIRTPNNVVIIGDEGEKGELKGFYVSNDHRRKVHWSRKWEFLYAEPSDIVYCSFEGDGSSKCKVAVEGLKYPNGIAKGHGNTLYSASSMGTGITVFDINSDNTLKETERIPIPRIMDNIHVDPFSGTVYAAAFPSIPELLKAFAGKGHSPTEIWAVKNSTDSASLSSYSFERVYADTSPESSITTASAPWDKDKLLLTGVSTPGVTICSRS